MSRVIETTVYKFDELSDEAKKKAREGHRRFLLETNFWSESVIDDAATIADLFGLDIKMHEVKTMSGGVRMEPSVWWSGFSSQGDGACFDGAYTFKEGGLKAVMECAPQDEDLHAIVKRIEDAQAPVFNCIGLKIRQSGHYSHSGCMEMELHDIDEDLEPELDKLDSKAVMNAERDVIAALRSYADWVYRNLEKESDWQSADEQVDESIRANEYEFTEEGEIV